MESVIDIEGLVAPIGEDNPSGSDPRDSGGFDSPYHRLKDAREAAMSAERPDTSAQPEDGGATAGLDTTNWSLVIDEAQDILKNQGKDLEVCALLIEGLARVYGPAGIRDGFLLTARIIEGFWDGLFPVLDPNEEDSLDDRLASFSGLNGIGQPGTLATFIAKLPITGKGYDDYRSYDYDRAWAANSNPDMERREEQLEKLGFTLEDIERAANETPLSFFLELSESVAGSLDALSVMDEAFMSACGHDAPPTSMISEALTKVSDVVKYLAGDRMMAAEESAWTDAEDTSEHSSDAAGSTPPGSSKLTSPTGAITGRDDAIARLRVVADYFRESEPHSPLSYSLQNIIRWAKLPLDKLIEEWISDYEARERYMLMTGMQSGSQPDSHSDEEDEDYN